MNVPRAIACGALLTLAACGGLAPRGNASTPPPTREAAQAPLQAPPESIAEAPPAKRETPSAPPAKEAAVVKPPPASPPPRDTEPRQPQSRRAPKSPAVERAATKPVPKAEAKRPEKPASSPPAIASAKPAAPAPPPLDLDSLERRLKESDAIGVMTKLSLRNQVGDLLERFRDYYAGRTQTTLAELRRPFDLLLMKVLSLLQDRDPALARAIRDSREALWAILADRTQFEKLT